MLFDVYGDNAVYQWIGWIIVFLALIGFNEIARRTKIGGITCFLVIPGILTAYFIAIYAGAAAGAEWALNNPTYRLHEQLVPLCQALRRHRRLHRLHDAEVSLGHRSARPNGSSASRSSSSPSTS